MQNSSQIVRIVFKKCVFVASGCHIFSQSIARFNQRSWFFWSSPTMVFIAVIKGWLSWRPQLCIVEIVDHLLSVEKWNGSGTLGCDFSQN